MYAVADFGIPQGGDEYTLAKADFEADLEADLRADLKADLKADARYDRGSSFCLARQMLLTDGVPQLRSYSIWRASISLESRLCLAIRHALYNSPTGLHFHFFLQVRFQVSYQSLIYSKKLLN